MRKILLAMTVLGTLAYLSEGRVDLTATESDAIISREIAAPLLPDSSNRWIAITPQPGTTSCNITITDMQPGTTYFCAEAPLTMPIVVGGGMPE